MEDGSIDDQSAITQLQQAAMSAEAKADQIRQVALSDSPSEHTHEDDKGHADDDEDGEEAGDEAADDDEP